jgi:hypothetical protein
MSSKHAGHTGGNWTDPEVGSKNLMVYGPQLTSVASSLSQMAGDLNTQLATWHGDVTPADSSFALGNWHAAYLLHEAVQRAHAGVRQFAKDLADWHEQVAGKLKTSVDNYLEAEHDNLAVIRKVSAGDHKAIAAELRGVSKGQKGAGRRVDANEKTWQNFPVRSDAFDKGSVAGYNYADIRALLESTQPEVVSVAGAAHTKLSGQLAFVADTLVHHTQALADNWSGTSAELAMGHMQQLHQTASDLHEKTASAGQALSRYGPVLQHYKSTLPAGPQHVAPPQLPRGTSISVASTAWQTYNQQVSANASLADQAAQQHLAELNGHIETAYHQMPTEVRKNLPRVPASASAGSHHTPGPTSGGSPSTGPGNNPGPTAPGPAPSQPPAPSPQARTTPPVTNPGLVNDGSRLAGLSAPGTMISPSPVSSAGPGSAVPPGGPQAGNLVIPGVGVRGTGAGSGAGEWGDPTSPTTQAPGSGADVAGAGAADGSGSGEGTTGFPMGGGPAGSAGGQERSRQLWEPEDSEIWAGSDEGPWVGETPGIGADGVINGEADAGDTAAPVAVVPGDASPQEPAVAPPTAPAADDAGFLVADNPRDNQQPNASARQAWMDEVPDLWGDEGHDVTPIIG